MYTLFSGLYKHLSRKFEYSVLLVGLDHAGKTTLLEKLKGVFNGTKILGAHQIVPTVGLNIGKINHGGLRLNVLDVGGQQDLRSLWERYFQTCHGVAFVIDSADRERFATALAAFSKLLNHPDLQGVPIIILANKQDLSDISPIDDLLSIFCSTISLLGDRDCRIQPLCALTGEGVREAMEWLLNCMKLHDSVRPPVIV